VLEEATSPAFPLVVPELPKLLLEDLGRAQSLVGLEQQLQTPAPIRRQALPMRQQRVLLALDEAPARSCQPGILGLAHRIQRLAKMTQHVEFVEQDGRLWRVLRLQGRVAECLPHVHDRQSYLLALRRAQPLVELVHARFRAVLSPEPDRPPPLQVADHDPVRVPFADRDFVDPDHLRSRLARSTQLLLHVLRVEGLDRLPVQPGFRGHVLDRHASATPSHEEGEALGVEGVGPASPASPASPCRSARSGRDGSPAPDRAACPRREVADSACLAVVPASLDVAAGTAGRFFPRRWRRTTRAFGSPKMPRIVGLGQKPGKR
jgi:hypothetical protein